MQIPQTHGHITDADFLVYTACDRNYFNQFGKIFCQSVKRTNNTNIHLHLFNPSLEQIKWCQDNQIGLTWEEVTLNNFISAATNLSTRGGEGLRRTHVAMEKGNDVNLLDRIAKTYYACARFVRLAPIHQQCGTIFACDIDAIVRKPIPKLDPAKDFYIHQIFGSKARFLAGGLYLNPGARQFTKDYAGVLTQHITEDNLYWSLDQDVLDPLVPKFNYGQLPETLIDWKMQTNSVIWTAKGARKNNNAFVNEQKQYIV